MSEKLKLTVMSVEEAKSINPVSYDDALAVHRGIALKSVYEEKYLLLQAAYTAALNELLERKTALQAYQKKLQESGLRFLPDADSLFVRFASFGRKHISIRNTPFIEQLSFENLEILKNAVKEGTVIFTEELLQMVERTYRDVIHVVLEGKRTDPGYPIVYEEYVFDGRKAMSDALILELSYATPYDAAGNLADPDGMKPRLDFSKNLAARMEKEMTEALACPVKVFIEVGIDESGNECDY